MCSQNCVSMYKKLLVWKTLIVLVVTGFFMVAMGFSTMTSAMDKGSGIEHPIKKPKMYSKTKRCPNCGMMINMWARTRHSFSHPEGDFTTCSIRCMADKANSSGSEPGDGAQVAVYLNPDKMMPVSSATYVIGSSAAGTMTMKSKIAFADKAAAENFAQKHGGQVMDFKGAYAAAKMELPKSRMLIDKKRKKTGKIKEPSDKDHCTVCGMYPAKFTKHNSQILAKNGDTLHFCSTKCFVTYNAAPAKYMDKPQMTKMAWVTLYSDGIYESAFGAYYVVGSKMAGPMGPEAFPFKLKKNAEAFVKANGGKIVSFPQLTPEVIGGMMH